MILKKDEYGRTTKEAETSEEYLLLEIERLKQENEELKQQIINHNNNKVLSFVFMDNENVMKGKYTLEMNEKGFFIEKVDDK